MIFLPAATKRPDIGAHHRVLFSHSGTLVLCRWGVAEQGVKLDAARPVFVRTSARPIGAYQGLTMPTPQARSTEYVDSSTPRGRESFSGYTSYNANGVWISASSSGKVAC